MTELELRHLRREKWRLEGEPIRTIEEAREFVDSVGMCLMYPTRPMPLLPTFIGAIAGSDQKLPTRNTALNDPCGMQTEELLARLAREKSVHEAQLHGETLVLSAQLFPYFYALASDRKPKQPIVSRTRPLSQHLFRKLEERGPLSRAQLQEQLGGALSEVALDRTLQELWTALKVTRVDHRSDGEDRWDVYYRWAPEAVNEGVRLSDAEALSALISKYLDCVVAATQDEIETTFSAITSRTRVAEVVRSLLSAREFTYTPSETRTLITVAHSIARPESPRAQVDGRGAPLAPRRRNG
jgi:23S rRNA pseudouridine2605 synthase